MTEDHTCAEVVKQKSLGWRGRNFVIRSSEATRTGTLTGGSWLYKSQICSLGASRKDNRGSSHAHCYLQQHDGFR